MDAAYIGLADGPFYHRWSAERNVVRIALHVSRSDLGGTQTSVYLVVSRPKTHSSLNSPSSTSIAGDITDRGYAAMS